MTSDKTTVASADTGPALAGKAVCADIRSPMEATPERGAAARDTHKPHTLAGWAITRLVSAGRPLARKVLPVTIRHRLVGLFSYAERLATPSLRTAFRQRPIRLAQVPPVLPPSAFLGPTLLVNNALAWGGVERQIVYTLLGLQQRLNTELGLLCLRLGVDANHDFYRSALTDFNGAVRNVLPLAEAEEILTVHLTTQQRQDIEACISWMPGDVQEEIRRFLADFLVQRPAVVHVWQDALSLSAGYAARIAGVPRVIVAGRNVAPIHFGYHRAFMPFAYAELASCPGLTMLNNSQAGAASYAKWLGLPESRFAVLRNGIDAHTIAPPAAAETAALKAELGIPPDAPVVGSIFRFYDEKRPLLWVKAAAVVARQRPDVHFVIFGTGPLRDKMMKRARQHGFAERLHLPGTLDKPALGLSLLDVFLLTSKFEGTPNVVLEAGLMGVPVVATDAGGTIETIDQDRTGFVVRSGHAAELGAKVLTVLDNEALRRAMALASPAFILNRFGLERMIDDTVRLYRA